MDEPLPGPAISRGFLLIREVDPPVSQLVPPLRLDLQLVLDDGLPAVDDAKIFMMEKMLSGR